MTTPSSPDPYRPDPAPSPGAQPTGGGYPGPGFPEAGGPGSPGYPAPGAAAYPSTPPVGPPAYPAGQPGYPQYGAPAPTAARPGSITASAVIGFVIGGLTLISSLIVLTSFATLNVGGIYVFIVILALIAAVGLIWGGIQALGGKDGRIIVAAAGLGILSNLIGLFVYFSPTSLLSFVLPILVIALMMGAGSKQWLDAKGAPHF